MVVERAQHRQGIPKPSHKHMQPEESRLKSIVMRLGDLRYDTHTHIHTHIHTRAHTHAHRENDRDDVAEKKLPRVRISSTPRHRRCELQHKVDEALLLGEKTAQPHGAACGWHRSARAAVGVSSRTRPVVVSRHGHKTTS